MNVFKSYPLPWRHDILTGNRYGQGIVYDANNQRVPHFPIISEDNERGQQAYEAITETLNENAELKQRIAELEAQLASTPPPIKPLEWQDFDEFIWAEGINCIYKYWVIDRAFDVLNKHGEQTLSIDNLTFVQAKQQAQAHHDAQVIQLLNLPE